MVARLLPRMRRLAVVDYVVAFVLLALGVLVILFLFQPKHFVTVRVRITDRDIVWTSGSPPSWFAYQFRSGMKEKDFIGRATAEVTDVYFYDSLNIMDPALSRKTVNLTVRLRANYNRITGEYKYKGSVVTAGEIIKLYLGAAYVNGLIVYSDTQQNPLEIVYPVIRVLVKEKSINQSGGVLDYTGVDEFVSDALNVKDSVFGSGQEQTATIIEKAVVPAQMTTTDNLGIPHVYPHPTKKDVYLTLRVKAVKLGSELYFLDDFLLKVHSVIPLNFPKISVAADIISISLSNQ